MRSGLSLFIILLLCGYNIVAQNRTSNWLFCEGIGLKFSKNSVDNFNGGKTYYQEGVSSISDMNGNLLFYTEGYNVYDRTHTLMPEGDSLKGHYSSTQGSIIIKQPGKCNLYYIFTLDALEHGFANGLNYTIVDMDLNNGKGDVISKNNLLYTPSSEKLAAVYNKDGTAMWVVTHEMFSNRFYVYLLSENGLNETPVISASGTSFSESHFGLGQMKISPQGDRLAYTGFVKNIIEVFDFDNETGIISNAQTMSIASLDVHGGYGLEFSPSGRFLYATKFSINYLNEPGSLYQFDLEAGNINEVFDKVILVGHNKPPSDMRGLQLALNGKIYVSNSLSTVLGVIADPDKLGLECNYIDQGQSLNNRNAGWTLPNFPVSYILEKIPPREISRLNIDGNCTENQVNFSYELFPGQNLISWDFGDGSASSELNPVYIYEQPGKYTVTLITELDCKLDTIIKQLEILNCNNKVYIPNVFSPNGDGINDVLYVYGPGITGLEMEIFDRWGEKVFQTKDISTGWDGKFNSRKMNPGVFVYQANLKFGNGYTQSVKGEVVLISGK